LLTVQVISDGISYRRYSIGSGTSFNPVGVSNSGLSQYNTHCFLLCLVILDHVEQLVL
jgi:hypothetical protein